MDSSIVELLKQEFESPAAAWNAAKSCDKAIADYNPDNVYQIEWIEGEGDYKTRCKAYMRFRVKPGFYWQKTTGYKWEDKKIWWWNPTDPSIVKNLGLFVVKPCEAVKLKRQPSIA